MAACTFILLPLMSTWIFLANSVSMPLRTFETCLTLSPPIFSALPMSKKIQVLIKGSKIKVQAAIQEEKVRVTGGKRDDLQSAMALIKSENADVPLSFNNFRD